MKNSSIVQKTPARDNRTEAGRVASSVLMTILCPPVDAVPPPGPMALQARKYMCAAQHDPRIAPKARVTLEPIRAEPPH